MQMAANQALTRGVLEYDQRHGYRGPVKALASNSNFLNELKDIPTVNSLIPAVVTEVRDQEILALMKDGRRIIINWTGISWAKPSAKTAAEILATGNVIYVNGQGKNQWALAQVPLVEGSLVALNPDTGAVLSLVGGFDYEKSSFNRAAQASRQPGSSFKPFIYAAALENGFTTASVLNDAPITQDDTNSDEWRPQNHTKEFHGPTRLRVALTRSMNMVSIRLLQALGIQKAITFISNCGIPSASLTRGLSLALGTNHLTPLEFAAAFSMFPNGGHKVEAQFIDKIVDYQNNEIFKAHPPTVCNDCLEINSTTTNNMIAPRVMSAQSAYLVTSMLQDVINHGSSKRALQLGRTDLAGKTGTTNDHFDGWFAGYNRDVVAITWMGFDEPKTLKEYAVSTALPMWIYFMEQALKGKPNHSPDQPPGIVTVRIDPATGLLARAGQTDAIYEQFTEETAPKIVATTGSGASTSGSNQASNHLLDVETIF